MNEFLQQCKEPAAQRQLSPPKKRLLTVLSVVFLLPIIFALYVAFQPQWVTLIHSEDTVNFQKITAELNSVGIKYQSGTNYIKVIKIDLPRAAMQLANAGLLERDVRPGEELFGQTRLVFSEQMYTISKQRALENELKKIIEEGSRSIQNAYVKLNIPKPTLFKEDYTPPSACIKVIAHGRLSEKEVAGIQRIIAFSIDKMQPSQVILIDDQDRILSEETNGIETHQAGGERHE